jgi:hypothetical protein
VELLLDALNAGDRLAELFARAYVDERGFVRRGCGAMTPQMIP